MLALTWIVLTPLSSALSGYDNRLSLADLQKLSPDLQNELVQLSNDEAQSLVVRGRAISLLGNFSEATPALLALSAHPSAKVRLKAEKSLRHLDRGDLTAHFAQSLQDADPFVRIEAARALAPRAASRTTLFERLRIEHDTRVRDSLAALLAR